MKNKLWKKILTVGLVAAMAVTVVAGCGGKGDSGDKEKNGTASDEGGGTEASITMPSMNWWKVSWNRGTGYATAGTGLPSTPSRQNTCGIGRATM